LKSIFETQKNKIEERAKNTCLIFIQTSRGNSGHCNLKEFEMMGTVELNQKGVEKIIEC
jgi:hypothetical protein